MRKQTRLDLCEEHLKYTTIALDKAFKCLVISSEAGCWLVAAAERVKVWCQSCGAKTLCEKVRPYLGPWDSARLRTASTHWNVPGKYGPHGELFFFLIKKEQVVTSNEVLPNPLVSTETLKRRVH